METQDPPLHHNNSRTDHHIKVGITRLQLRHPCHQATGQIPQLRMLRIQAISHTHLPDNKEDEANHQICECQGREGVDKGMIDTKLPH